MVPIVSTVDTVFIEQTWPLGTVQVGVSPLCVCEFMEGNIKLNCIIILEFQNAEAFE